MLRFLPASCLAEIGGTIKVKKAQPTPLPCRSRGLAFARPRRATSPPKRRKQPALSTWPFRYLGWTQPKMPPTLPICRAGTAGRKEASARVSEPRTATGGCAPRPLPFVPRPLRPAPARRCGAEPAGPRLRSAPLRPPRSAPARPRPAPRPLKGAGRAPRLWRGVPGKRRGVRQPRPSPPPVGRARRRGAAGSRAFRRFVLSPVWGQSLGIKGGFPRLIPERKESCEGEMRPPAPRSPVSCLPHFQLSSFL